MKKLKVAVGITGRVLFLENFPDDQEHSGLNDELRLIEEDAEVKELPGIYLASFRWNYSDYYDGSHDGYLDIEKLELE